MRGRRFIRVSDNGEKFSNLDRFFVSKEFKQKWGNLATIALDQKLSDHCPIILKDSDVDFGTKPFRALDVWLDDLDVNWVALKRWSKDRFKNLDKKIDEHIKEAMRWKCEVESRDLNEDELKAWMRAMRLWIEEDGEKENILKQKARVKWDAEGDENSNFFQAAVTRRNNIIEP
uniref:Putative RNA-directed DNA polymerase, eukaryota, reverse transcriptase zinc-binding domain protein n=1 Tax=Tanacetum cinerariifolium TaxID=118510 RepID=A0A6L2LH52_TANCI|nr:putative RNA-directed DNA polymerase, eukaryota, reverse transcriptase zinc-binding domain protein [Tanacetum cinerariifolium]GEU60379.1 putative RNA-directed DNA polymerase, eukaryota, reverse transcriptase zinc-binding domain protein [Tanacetum cinerariifolium]